MTESTANLGLFKPDGDDPIDVIADISVNMDIIDAEIHNHETATTNVHGIADTSKVEVTTHKGVSNGYAALDSTGHLPVIQAALGTEFTNHKDQPSGYAGLDSGGLLNLSEFPAVPESQVTNLQADLAARAF